MCLAIPMQIQAIDGLTARCEAKGSLRDVSLYLLQDDLPRIGDYVQVSLGNAIQKVSAEDARLAWEMFDLILSELGHGITDEQSVCGS
jgi:hydrogenase expression/formation protein HypC